MKTTTVSRAPRCGGTDSALQARAVAGTGPTRSRAPTKQWVCHGSRSPRWIEVSEATVGAHQRHGHRIFRERHGRGASCRPG